MNCSTAATTDLSACHSQFHVAFLIFLRYNRKKLSAAPQMQGGSRLLRDFIRKNRQIYLFALFPLIWLAYFLSASRQCERMLMHCPLDGLIPFLPVFIIPYVLWYLYVPTALLLNCFSDPAYFKRQCVCFFGGAGVCLLVIMLFPTAVDFRPEITEAAFSAVCAALYFQWTTPCACSRAFTATRRCALILPRSRHPA